MVDLASPFNALIASNQQQSPGQNPLTTLGQFAQTKSALANADTATSQADDAALANAQNHVGYIINGMTPLLAKGANVTAADVAQEGSNLVAETKGRVSAQEIASFVGQLPTDGAGIQASLQQHLLRLQSANDRIATLRGQPTAIATGGGTQLGTRNAFTGAYQPQGGPSGYVPNTLSPEGAAASTPGPVNPLTGAVTTITTGERAEQAGLAPAGTYTGRGGGAIPVTVLPNGRITKRPQSTGGAFMSSPSSLPPAGAAGGFGAGTSATMPSGAIQTAPSPGQATALKTSGDQFAAAGQTMATYAQQQQQLSSALDGLKSTNTGPGTESRQAIASYMLALPGGIGQYLPGVDPKSIQAYDEANKYLTQTASGSPNAARSDAGLNTALASSPSVHISNAAAQDVLKANIGFRRAEMANYAAFQKTGLDPGQFTGWLAQRNQQIDPRAYSVDLLSPQQRQTAMAGMSPAAKTKFLGTVRDAIGSGIIDPNALAGGGAAGGQ